MKKPSLLKTVCIFFVFCVATAVASPAQTSTTLANLEATNGASATAAQTAIAQTDVPAAQVPRLVKFSGTLKGVTTDGVSTGIVLAPGTAPTSVVGITFSLYAEQTGGAALWSEVQNVRFDTSGRYTVQLGATQPQGLPLELFSSAQAQWLGVQVQGQAEQPRIMLVSVPYALKAADAATLGGKPPSAYEQVDDTGTTANANGAAGSGPGHKVKNDHPLEISGSGTTNYVPLWTNPSTLASSVIFQLDNNIGIGTDAPEYPLTVIDSGTAIVGASTGESGGGVGVSGSSAGPEGWGVQGTAESTTGNNNGMRGESSSPDGVGVYGYNDADTGDAVGVLGNTASPEGYAVYGEATSSSSGITYGVFGESASTNGVGVLGTASADTGTTWGVGGYSASDAGIGVYGEATSTTGKTYGVQGTTASEDGVGVEGEATSTTGVTYGLAGTTASDAGYGVLGSATSTTGVALGVQGQTSSTTDTAAGVVGVAFGDTGAVLGVVGNSYSPTGYGTASYNYATSGLAVAAGAETSSGTGIAMVGAAVAPSVNGLPSHTSTIGVVGTTNQGAGIGIAGAVDDGRAVAGLNYSATEATARFENGSDEGHTLIAYGLATGDSCSIDVNGNVTCTGQFYGGSKLDAGQRTVLLSALQGAESWNEDAGSALLAHGSAVVQLEPTFAQTINGEGGYHVFLTPNGDCKGLYVTNKTANSFEVRELGGGTASIAFDYRILAHRRGYENVRLTDVTARLAAMAEKRGPNLQRLPLRLPTVAKAAMPSPLRKATPKLRRSRRIDGPVHQKPTPHPAVKKRAEPQQPVKESAEPQQPQHK